MIIIMDCLTFPEKWFCIHSAKFCNFKHCTNTQLFGRFDLGICKTSEQLYRKLQYGENFFGKF